LHYINSITNNLWGYSSSEGSLKINIMAEETGYFDFSKAEKAKEKLDSVVETIKSILDFIKSVIAKFLPENLQPYLNSSIGDAVILFFIILIFYVILKAFGFAFKMILRIIYIILILVSLYIIYLNFFYNGH